MAEIFPYLMDREAGILLVEPMVGGSLLLTLLSKAYCGIVMNVFLI
jgi:hypothetical protein